MIHKVLSSIEEVPYCFARSYVKFQGRTALKIIEFEFANGYEMLHGSKNQITRSHGSKNRRIWPNWAFPDCNSNLNSPMGMKWYTKLEVA